MLILFAYVSDTDSFVGRLNFSPANDHIKRNCAKVTSKKSKLSRVGGRGRFRGREGLSWAAPAALRETSSRPRATLFFSAGFFSLEKKRVQTSKTRFVHGDRGKILRFRRNRIFRKVLVPAQPGEMGWAPFQENFILLAEQADISSGILSCLLFAKQRKQTDRTADDTLRFSWWLMCFGLPARGIHIKYANYFSVLQNAPP